MGLMTSMAVGAMGGIGHAGVQAFYQEQRALIDRERAAYEVELKQKYEATNRERMAGYGKAVTNADAARLAREGGDIEASKNFAAMDNLEKDNARADRRESAQEGRWKSEDEKWRKQFEETVRNNREMVSMKARELNLKEGERKDLDNANAAYTAAIERVLTQGDAATKEDKAAVSVGAAKMARYGIKVPALETNDKSTKAQIASTLLKLADEDFENAPRHREAAGRLLHEAAAGKSGEKQPETKVFGGNTYVKVPGGWKLQTK